MMLIALWLFLIFCCAGGAVMTYMAYLDWLWRINERLYAQKLRQAWLERVRASAKDALDVPYIES